MTQPGRISCLNPNCRRTCADDGETTKMICGKCWRLLPPALREERNRFNARNRRLLRLAKKRLAAGTVSVETIEAIAERQVWQQETIWRRIEACFKAPETPVGLDSFLHEVGL